MAKPQSYKTDTHERFAPGACSRLIFHVSVHTIPWVPEDVFFVEILIVGGEALPREKLFSSHPSLISSKHEFQRLEIYVARLGKRSCFSSLCNWKGRNILPSRAIDRLVLVPLTLTNMVSTTHYEFTGIHIFKNVD